MKTKAVQKELAAKRAASYIKDGMTIGLGTGSTAYFLIQEVGDLVDSGMQLQAVVTSEATWELAKAENIPIIMPEETKQIDLAIDGVDRIDKGFHAVKGGGGALFREKIIASKADEVIWIMDESKLVEELGEFPLPVEVLPFGYSWIIEVIENAGGNAVLRYLDGYPYRTDNGNFILDVTFSKGMDYQSGAQAIMDITGVLETGFFDRICSRIIVGSEDGVREIVNPVVVSDSCVGNK